ncbi:MAG: hypothetical protein AAFW89_11885 [Bacteroidota bacterium]
MNHSFLLFFLFSAFVWTACSSGDDKSPETTPADQSISEQVDALIDADKYEEALDLLNSEVETPEIVALKEKTHLNYGIYTVYQSDPSAMRENANKGLREFIAVLTINPQNQKARSEIDQIVGIYKSMNRAPEPDVAESLKAFGYEF